MRVCTYTYTEQAIRCECACTHAHTPWVHSISHSPKLNHFSLFLPHRLPFLILFSIVSLRNSFFSLLALIRRDLCMQPSTCVNIHTYTHTHTHTHTHITG